MEHVLDQGALSDLQFGFRPESSTQEALLSATQFWHAAMEGGGSALCVFLDLAKAFDSVSHSRVLAALSEADVAGSLLCWFRSYLTNRRQFVAIQGFSSDPAAVTSGVPQGSILGPLLFILTFNDIFNLNLSSNSLLTGYADDVMYSKVIKEGSDFGAANSDLSTISVWLQSQSLRLNEDKVKCMMVSRKRSVPEAEVLLGERRIEQVSSFKLLSVTISQDLSWRSHISNTCARARKTIGLLYRIFSKAGPATLNHLYKVLVRPTLDYASSIWDPPHSVHKLSLERVQNFGARVALNSWSRETEPDALKARLGWPRLETHRTAQKISLCRRILGGNFIIPSSVFIRHQKPTKSHKNSIPLFRQYVRTAHHRSSFLHDVVDKWNSIPDHIIASTSTANFKKQLNHFLSN